jgi:hypothetical protein
VKPRGHNGFSGLRGQAPAAGGLIGTGFGLQPPGFVTPAAGTEKPVGAGLLIAEALLELDRE